MATPELPNPLPYATPASPSDEVRIETFADHGVTITIPAASQQNSFEIILIALGLCASLAWLFGLGPGVAAGIRFLWPVPLVLVTLFAVVGISRHRRHRRSDVVGLSADKIYADVWHDFDHVKFELPRERLRQIELLFSRDSLSTEPVGILILVQGRRPLRFAEQLSTAQVQAIFDALRSAILATSKPGDGTKL